MHKKYVCSYIGKFGCTCPPNVFINNYSQCRGGARNLKKVGGGRQGFGGGLPQHFLVNVGQFRSLLVKII